jgi:putative redox protein
LAARLDRPDGAVRAWALFAHCFTCGKDINVAGRIAAALARQGIATVRFDFTGLGGSGGDFANTHFSSNIADLLAAVAHMRETGRAPSLLIGHSLGGAAVLAVAGQAPEVNAVATLAAPFDVGHVVENFGEHTAEIEAAGEAVVNLAGRPFTIRRAFLDDVRRQDQQARIAGLRRALLVLHAPGDQVVAVDDARKIFDAAMHPKSFVSLDDADHLLSRPEDAEYAAGVIAGWSSRYLPMNAPEPMASADPGTVIVESTGAGRFEQRVAAGRHTFIADEPESVAGGRDTGPDPYSLLLASIGACTSMTVRMYAERKGLPLQGVRVELRHRRDHVADCEGCETDEGARMEAIERVITLAGALDEAGRAALLRIADRCPVHRTLEGGVRVLTQLADG